MLQSKVTGKAKWIWNRISSHNESNTIRLSTQIAKTYKNCDEIESRMSKKRSFPISTWMRFPFYEDK